LKYARPSDRDSLGASSLGGRLRRKIVLEPVEDDDDAYGPPQVPEQTWPLLTDVGAVIYRELMPPQLAARSYGRVFNEIAEDYDRHRPTYPDVLVDEACKGLSAGAAVLEIGCGTGQLTRSLLARGLRVTAVEPGQQLIARAREHLHGTGDVQFVNARLEDAPLPRAHYSAMFSASAIHWIDPDVSWRKVADALVDGGSLALLSYFGLDDPRSAEDQQALRATLTAIAPELAAEWPSYRELDDALAGVAARRENLSEAWAWLGDYEIARGYAADLFDDAQIGAVPMQLEHTAGELNALLGTMSFWARLSPPQREALLAENRSFHHRLGRPIRSSAVACLLVARRRPRI
jgi:SAM-dependent methyltransferase